MKVEHYNKGNIEVIDFIQDQLTPEEFNGFCKGNILKYVPRSNHKSDPIADAQKVRDYADYWINANLRANKLIQSREAAIDLKKEIDKLKQDSKRLERVNVEGKEIISRLKDMQKTNSKAYESEVNTLETEIEKLKDVAAKRIEAAIDQDCSNQQVLNAKDVEIRELKGSIRQFKTNLGLNSPKRIGPVSNAELCKDFEEFQVPPKRESLLEAIKRVSAETLQAQHEPPKDVFDAPDLRVDIGARIPEIEFELPNSID